MTKGLRQSTTGPLLLVFLIAGGSHLVGCSPRKPERSGVPDSADTLANGLSLHAVPGIAPWLAMWQTALPGIAADSLLFGGAGPAFRGGYVQPSSDFDSLAGGEAAAFRALTAGSPGGRYRLVFDRYHTVSIEDGVVEISGEPDSAPLLLDEHRQTAHTFESCGTPCGYDWGCWVDSTRFALGGWAELDSAPDSLRGVLGIYSLSDSTVTRYFTRPVPRARFESYRAAWVKWITDRLVTTGSQVD